jgi:uncharacterized glyoxalase superfamily protein PhnB
MTNEARQNVFPALHYRDANAAIDWLKQAFGAEEKEVHRGDDGVVQHAELQLGTGLVMLGQVREGGFVENASANGATSIYVVIEDPDAHCARAKAAGAEIHRELTDQDYGSRDYAARDLEGNLWSFGTYDPFGS